MAATGNYETIIGMRADVDLSSYQYYFVEAASTADYVQRATTGSTTLPLGVLQNDPDDAGEGAEVAYSGIVKVVANAASAISYGTLMTWDSSGRASPAVVGTSSSNTWCVGRFLEALSSGSARITALLTTPFKLGTS